MLNPLSSSSALPASAPAPQASHPATAGAASDGAARTADMRGGFARALEQAAASDPTKESSLPEDTEPAKGSADGTPRDGPVHRQNAGKATAKGAASAQRLERSATAPTQPPAGLPADPPLAPHGLHGLQAEPTSTDPASADTATAAAAVVLPENGALGALLSQLQAAAAAATSQVNPEATSSLAKAGSGANDKLVTDGPGARKATALARSESARQALGNNPTLSANSNEALVVPTRFQASVAANNGERPGSAAFAAEPGFAGNSSLIATPPAQASMTAHNAPTLIGGAGSSNTMSEARLSASPGSPDFGPQLGAQITTFVRDGLEHARLQLHPADMGPVLVQIQLDGQTAQVHLSAEHAVTRQALEAALPQLASQLREAGLTLSGGGVSEQAQQGRQAPSDNPSRPTSTPESARPEPQEPSRTLLRRGVVDLVA